MASTSGGGDGPPPAPAPAPAPAPSGIQGDVPLAVIGMSCRVGGVVGYEELWQLLLAERETRVEVPYTRWSRQYHAAVGPGDAPPPGKSNTMHAHFLSPEPRSHFSAFDAGLFGLSGKEAADTDPQQRMFMELAYEAFEDARVPVEQLRGSATGVFVGVMNNDYSFGQSTAFSPYSSTGLANSIASNRLSYLFDLRGPSQTLDTACSSSLVCLHNAARALRANEIDLALIGGGNIMCNMRVPLALSAMRLLSSDGRSKAFDRSGDGYARAEGGGMLVLKRLDAALRDGDRIHAVLRGSAVNSDGRASVPIVAPDVRSQMALLARAYQQAGLPPSAVEYVEAHGTGTALGDAVEAQALFNFFLNEGRFIRPGSGPGQGGDPTGRALRIGSIKSNIGHLEAGAGSLGLIKAILCLKHRTLVRSLHFREYHSHFAGDASRLRVQQRAEPWLHDAALGPLRVAGVSSFGYGGTNAHVVVQEYAPEGFEGRGPRGAGGLRALKPAPPAPLTPEQTTPLLILLSAHSVQSLRQLAGAYAAMLAQPETDLLAAHRLCAAASATRGLLGFRLTGVARSPAALSSALHAFSVHESEDGDRAAAAVTLLAPSSCRLRFLRVAKGSTTFVPVGASSHLSDPASLARRVVLVFAGQGSQWRGGVPRALLRQFPALGATLQRLESFCAASFGWSLLEYMLLPGASTAASAAHQERRRELERADSAVSGVAIFAAEAALLMQLRAWGLQADYSLSHSLGEFAASFYSGALSLHECVRMVHTISRLVGGRAPRGHMVDCRIGAAEVQGIIRSHGLERAVYVAARNAPYSVTLAGTDGGLAALQEAVRASHGAAKAQRLLQRVTSASAIPYHSPLLDEVPNLRADVVAALDAILSEPAAAGSAAALLASEDITLAPSAAHGQVTSLGVLRGEEARRAVRNGARWWRNIAEPVDFIAAVERAAEALRGAPAVHVLDLSPTPVLAANVQAIIESAEAPAAGSPQRLNVDDVSVWPVLARPDAALFDLQLSEAMACLLLAGGQDSEGTHASQAFPWAQEYGRLSGEDAVTARSAMCSTRLPPLPTQRIPFWSETLKSFRSRMSVWRNSERPPAHSVLNGLFKVLPFSSMDQHDASLTAVYLATVRPMSWPLILAHVFQESALLPASFSVELFSAIGRHIGESHPFVLEDLHWERALWMELRDEVAYQLRVEVKPLDEVSFTVQLLARQVSQDKHAPPAPLIRHVRGVLRMLDPAALPSPPPFSSELQSAVTTYTSSVSGAFEASEKYPLAWTHEKWYTSFREAGFAYGDCFTLVDSVCANPSRMAAMVRVRIPADVVADAAKQDYWMHPGVIDAVTQGIAGATSTSLDISASLPIQCTRISLKRNLFLQAREAIANGGQPQEVVLWAEVLNGGSAGVDDFADVLVYLPSGEHVATFEVFRSRGMNGVDEDKPAAVEQTYFEWQWAEKSGPVGTNVDEKNNPHCVVLHAAEQDPSPALLAECFGVSVRAHRWVADEKAPRTLPAHLLDGLAFGASVQVVVLLAGDAAAAKQSVEEQYARVHANSSWMLTIMQMLKELVATWSGSVSLAVLSPCCLGASFASGTSLTVAEEAALQLDLSTAALPGMIRVWQAECSSVTARVLCSDAWERCVLNGGDKSVEMAVLRASLRLELLVPEQPLQDFVLFVRSSTSEASWRRFAAVRDAVQLPTLQSTAEAEAAAIAADGGKRLHAFVLCGGNGSLGIELASMLTESLPREHCLAVFASRRGTFQSADDEKLAAIKLAQVRCMQASCNIAEPGAAASLLESVRADALARGYASVSIHLLNMAMVLRDALLENLSAHQFDEVLRPKVLGSLRLLQAAQALLAAPKQKSASGTELETRVESLTLFSSTTSFLGNVGQLAYGAANSFLDTLAVASHQQLQRSSQQQQLLPVYAFNFPPIVGAGFLANNDKVAAMLDHSGYISLTPREVYRSVRDLTAQAVLALESVSGSVLAAGPSGHASVGCVRIRPVPYLQQQPQIKQLFSWSKVVARWKSESVRLSPQLQKQLFGGGGAGGAVGAMDPASVAQLVAGMVADVQGQPSLSAAQLRATLSELGIDSQGVTLLNNHFKSTFQCTLPISHLLDPAATIHSVSKILSDKMQARAGAAPPAAASGDGAEAGAQAASTKPAASAGASSAVASAASYEFHSEQQTPFQWLLSGPSAQALQHSLSLVESRLRSWDSGVAGFVQAADAEQTFAADYQAAHACRRMITGTLGQLPGAVERLLTELGSAPAQVAPAAGAAAAGAAAAAGVQFVFLFPGQGSEFPGMLSGWLECVPFRKALEQCCRTLAEHWSLWVRDVADSYAPPNLTARGVQDLLFPHKPKPGAPAPAHAGSAVVQLALFVFSYSLARVLLDAGIAPSRMLGHSLGEVVAAAVAGVFSLADALRAVWVRGRVMERAPLGAMLAVRASEARVRELMQLAGVSAEELQVAAINGPQQTVLAGLGEKVDAFAATLKQQKIPCSRLANKHAFHTVAMAPAAAALEKHLAGVKLNAPRVAYLSNVSGAPIAAEDAATPAYYARHMTQAVQFHRSALELVRWAGAEAEGKVALLELGPGSTLTKLLRTEPTVAAAIDEGRWVTLASCEKPAADDEGGAKGAPQDSFLCLSKCLSLAVQAGLPLKRIERLLYRPLYNRLLQLSYPQQRLWIQAALDGALVFSSKGGSDLPRRKLSAVNSHMLHEASPDAIDERSLAYITSSTYRLRGGTPLAAEDLQRAIGLLLQAHAVLRSSIAYSEDGTPVQRINTLYHAEREVLVERTDMASLSLNNEATWSKVWDTVKVESSRPFPLDRAPLFRVLLLQFADGQLMHFTFQHLIVDFHTGSTFGLELFRALSIVAQQDAAGAPTAFLPPPPRSAMDFGWSLREMMQSEAGERRLNYWLAKLAQPGLTLPHSVGAAASSPAERSAPRSLEVSLPAEQVALLQQVSTRYNSLPSTLLLALATAALYEQSTAAAGGNGSQAAGDVRVGMIHRPSNLRSAERVIGCLFDILVLSQPMDSAAAAPASLPALLEKWEATKAEAVQSAYPLTELLRRMRTEQQQQQRRGSASISAPRPAAAQSLWDHSLFELLYNFRSLSGGVYEAQRSDDTSIELVRHHHWREAQFPLQLDIDWPLGAHDTGAPAAVANSTPATISLTFDASISTEVAQKYFDAFLARVRALAEVVPHRPRGLSIVRPLTFAPPAEVVAVAAAASSSPSAVPDLIPQLPPPALTSEIFSACKDVSSVAELLVASMRHWGSDAVALEGNTLLPSAGTMQFTYRQLDQATDAFARRLLDLGVVAPVVGLALPRSVEMVVAAIGCLKAGRCYAPLDPEFFPQERMQRAILSTDMRVVVQAPRAEQQVRHLLTNVPASCQFLEFGLDSAALAAAQQAHATPLALVPQTRSSRAYVEFTSGSTGVPKAVAVTHGNLLSLIPDMVERFDFASDAKTLLFHSFSFDLHCWEVYGTLSVGGRLVVLPSVRDVGAIWSACSRHLISHLSMTPSAFTWFSRHHAAQAKALTASRMPPQKVAQGMLPDLRSVMLCGERLQYATLSGWFQTYAHLPQARAPRVINSYGITETTVISTFREVTALDVQDGPLSPPGGNPLSSRPSWIGLPFANQRFFLLKAETMEPVEAGQPGELFISGEAVAEGYLNAPTAAAFLRVSLPWLDGGRETVLYRTGDLLVWDAGRRDLSFLSRVDKTQLKVSGVRIEPMEIESVLVAMHDLLLAAVVAAVESPLAGNTLLVAYMQLVDKEPARRASVLEEVKRRLGQALPLSLHPRLVVMAQLPTTANLKADRVKLGKWETLQEADKAQPQPQVQVQATSSQTVATSVANPVTPPSVAPAASPSAPSVSSPTVAVASTNSSTNFSPAVDDDTSTFLSPSLVRDSLEIALHVVYRGVLGESFDPAARLFDDLGLSSMAATRLINLINDAFRCQLPGSVLWSHQTLYSMAALLRQNDFHRPAELLLPLSQRAMERDSDWSSEADAPGVALVLVYSAGGGAVHYLAFAKSIAQELPSLPIFSLERGIDAPERQLDAAAMEISQRLAGVPVVLCGFSSGGSLAYELAQMLPALDVPVQGVVLMDTPHDPTVVQPGYVLGNLLRTTMQRSAIAAKKPVSSDELEARVATFRSTIYRMLESADPAVLDLVYDVAAQQFSIQPFSQPSFLRAFVATSQEDCLFVKQHVHPRHGPMADRTLPVYFLAAVLESDPTLGLSAAHVWRERSGSKNFQIKHITADHRGLLMHADTRRAVLDACMPYKGPTAQITAAALNNKAVASPRAAPAPAPMLVPVPSTAFAHAPVAAPAPLSLGSPRATVAYSPLSAVSPTSSYVLQSPVSLPDFSPVSVSSVAPLRQSAPSPSPSLPITPDYGTALVSADNGSVGGESLHVRHVPTIQTVHMPSCVVGQTPARLRRELHSVLSGLPAVRRLLSAAATPAGLMNVFQTAVPFSMKESANSELFHDNLDTGNSCMEPFESVQTAMTMTTANDIRRYQPPEPTAELRNGVLHLMQHLGLLTPPARGGVSSAFDVVVGPGTSYFMHSLCSLLCLRPGDAVLLPTPGYGLFMPPVEECGGQIAFVHVDERSNWMLTAAELQRAVRDTNQRLMDTWIGALPEELALMRRRLIRAGVIDDAPNGAADWTAAAVQAVHAELAAAGPLGHAQGAADRVDRVLRRLVHVDLLGGVPSRLNIAESMRALIPSPPRVVAYLHINPDTFGRCYPAEACRPLAQVLADANVAVLEDLAYAMLQHDLPLGDFKLKSASMLEAEHWAPAPETQAALAAAAAAGPGTFRPRPLSSLRVYCMLGFSKGFSMPGLRLGCLVCPTALAPPIFQRVFTSVGFVASSLQRSLYWLCRALPQQLHSYLARNAVEWTLRRTVFLALVQGTDTLQLRSAMAASSLDLLRPLLSESCAAIWDSLASFRPWVSPAAMAESMLQRGLSDYFRVVSVPEAGFFCLLDSSPLLARSATWSRGDGLRSALEVCVFLKNVCGIKTIPEEALGLPLTLEHGRRKFDDSQLSAAAAAATAAATAGSGASAANHNGRPATLLRFSYSVSLPRLVQLLTQMHVQFARLEQLNAGMTA